MMASPPSRVLAGSSPAPLPSRKASTAVQHYCDTGTPINPSGFATRGRRMTPTSSQLDAAVGQFGPRERVVKPPTKSGELLVCELCDAGKLADGIAVSTVNKTGSAANAWGEKPHSEAQAWCDLVEADRPLGVSKLFKYSCVVCVRTAQVFSRALDRPVVTASHGDEQNLSALHAFGV